MAVVAETTHSAVFADAPAFAVFTVGANSVVLADAPTFTVSASLALPLVRADARPLTLVASGPCPLMLAEGGSVALSALLALALMNAYRTPPTGLTIVALNTVRAPARRQLVPVLLGALPAELAPARVAVNVVALSGVPLVALTAPEQLSALRIVLFGHCRAKSVVFLWREFLQNGVCPLGNRRPQTEIPREARRVVIVELDTGRC